MKIFALVCLFFAFAFAEFEVKTRENYMQYSDECVEEQHIPERYVEEYKKMEYPDDATTHCYMKCVYNKMGVFDDETGYQAENVYAQVVGSNSTTEYDEAIRAKIESCMDKNEQGSNACEWAYRGGMCISKNDMQMVPQAAAEEPQAEPQAEPQME